jgi:probable HAF family extracellular repeat protein
LLLSLGIFYNFPAQAQQSPIADAAGQDSAPQNHHHEQHHYKLVDLGTFGGPNSGVNIEPFQNVINNAGTVVGGADTSIPTPEPGCYNPVNNPDCFISHAFVSTGKSLKDLGTLPGGNFSFATAINRRGQIAGVSESTQIDPVSGNPEFHAVLWQKDKILDLGTMGGTASFAETLNDLGQVTGVALNGVPDPYSILGLGSGTTLTQTRAFLWQNGQMQDLGTLGGPDSWAVFVNDIGQVAGTSYTSDVVDPNTGPPQTPPVGVFLWENGKMKDLGNLGGDNALLRAYGIVNGLNNRGQVIGLMMVAGDQHADAFLWDGEKLLDLGSLGGSGSTAEGINDAGEVVGVALLPGDQTNDGFLWRNGVMTDLGTVGGDPCSVALSINSKGQVVGASESAAGGCNEWTTALLWENGAPGVDLNSLVPSSSGVHLTAGYWANDGGEIVAGGNSPVCDISATCGHAFLLIPCDEQHPNIEGCDYDLVDEKAATRQSLAPLMQESPAKASGKPALYGPFNDVRTMLRGRLGFNRFMGNAQQVASSGAAATSGPIATLSPTGETFSTEPIGSVSAAKIVTLKNTGTTSLTITAIAIAGTNAGDFAQTHPCGSTLASGASCNVSVTFKPAASGTRTAVLSVTDNAAGSPQKATLSGIGTAVKLSPSSLSFGSVGLGATSPPKTLTVSNVGTTTLSMIGIAINGTDPRDFAQTHNCGTSLAAGRSCALTVTFTPAVLGTRTASLNLSDNGAGSPQKVALSGMGVKGGKLTGYCVMGRLVGPPGCAIVSDHTQCTPGKPAINPVAVNCGVPFSINVDEGASCHLTGPYIGGRCQWTP